MLEVFLKWEGRARGEVGVLTVGNRASESRRGCDREGCENVGGQLHLCKSEILGICVLWTGSGGGSVGS